MIAEDSEPKPREKTTCNTTKRERRQEGAQPQDEAFKAHLGEQVLHLIGVPKDLYRVQVRSLWGSFYRANVLTGPEPPSVKIAQSYFLQIDGEGNIVSSAPKITRQYSADGSQEPCAKT
jgi:hypothetical protein